MDFSGKFSEKNLRGEKEAVGREEDQIERYFGKGDMKKDVQLLYVEAEGPGGESGAQPAQKGGRDLGGGPLQRVRRSEP